MNLYRVTVEHDRIYYVLAQDMGEAQKKGEAQSKKDGYNPPHHATQTTLLDTKVVK